MSDCPIITGSLVSRMTASLAAISCIPLHTLKSPETTMASTPSLTSSMAAFSSASSIASAVLPMESAPPLMKRERLHPRVQSGSGFQPMPIRPTSPPFPCRSEFVASVVDRPIILMSARLTPGCPMTLSRAPMMPMDRSS